MGAIILSLVTISITLGFGFGISVKEIGATWFLLPLAIGYGYLTSNDL